MKLHHKKRSMARPLGAVVLAIILATTITASLASATLNSSNGVATQSYSQSQSAAQYILPKERFVVQVTPTTTPEPTPEVSQEDRTQPIYEVYKDGIFIEVSTELQWMIRDMAIQYNYPEKIIFGLILKESTFDSNATGDNERSLGLCQIQKFWIRGANITHFTDDYTDRNLLDPYDNLLTLVEMWGYARDTYSIDITTNQGLKDLLYWHNTGEYIKGVNWGYSDKIFEYAAELVEIEY